jgi:hypothetical protein
VLTPLNKTAFGRSFIFCGSLSVFDALSTPQRHRSLFW